MNKIAVETALIGNSIVYNIRLNGCSTFSLSGSVVNEFNDLLPTMKSYAKIIVSLGGNNLSIYNESGEAPESVLAQLKELVDAIAKIENQPKVVVCTVLRRTKSNHSYINKFNNLLVISELSVFKFHWQVYKNQKFLEDGIHLTLRGRKTYACVIKKLLKEKFDDDYSFRNWLIDTVFDFGHCFIFFIHIDLRTIMIWFDVFLFQFDVYCYRSLLEIIFEFQFDNLSSFV